MAQRHTGRTVSSAPAWVALVALGALLTAAAAVAATPAAARAHAPSAGSDAARAWARRVIESGDNGHQPFAVVDKQAALVVLHRADGSIAGIAPALLGRQPGDHSLPGVGQRTQAGTLQVHDMTTPAGRFDAHPGNNHTGELVLWLDQNTALALHRLRPGRLHAVRARALAQQARTGRRLSAGCVVVTAAFFDTVVAPLFAGSGGIVYVLPEHSPWPNLWMALQASPG